MIGKTIAHYQIVEKLGEGGMGVVYRGTDTRLKRDVAIKFLSEKLSRNPALKQHMLNEARAVAALNHPNVATIYEVNEVADDIFIVMEFIDGQTLAELLLREGPLPLEKCLDYFRQMAGGIQAAHARKIIHRDIKSANVLITPDDRVKVLDFGIAKREDEPELTSTGNVLGTAGYMSPEQVRTDSVDIRSDIWSLGVVFYEMLTGQRPFQGDYPMALMYSIANEPFLPLSTHRPDIPAPLEKIMARLLCKNPDERYPEIAAVLADLDHFETEKMPGKSAGASPASRSPATAPAPDSTSVAVLPFADLSPGQDQEYFCDGIAEEIIDALGKVPNWRVVSRTSAFAFKGKQLDVREIGKQLAVSHVLEGSLRKSGNRVRIKATLVKAADGFQLWSEKYDRELADIFEIQDDIARTIVNTLKVRLISPEDTPLVRRRTENLDAYTCYLKGRHAWNKRSKSELQESLIFFEQAVAIDPFFALAYAGLADTYSILGNYGYLQPEEAYPRALFAAQKALEIDPGLAEAYPSLATVKAVYEWDWPGAAQAFEKALELNPNYPTARQWYAINYLVPVGKFAEALTQIRLAKNLDPLSHIIKVTEGLVHDFAGDVDAALETYREVLRGHPNLAVLYQFFGWSLGQKGQFREAVDALKQAIRLAGDDAVIQADLGYTYALCGEEAAARDILRRLEQQLQTHPSAHLWQPLAAICAALGDTQKTFEYLEKAVAEKSFRLIYLKVDPRWKALRSRPAFTAILKKINLM